TAIPAAQDQLAFVPGRLLAVAGNSLGVLAVVAVALGTLRRRPLPSVLVLAGVATAAAGSAVGSLGAAGGAVTIAAGVALLYAGFVAPARLSDGLFRRPRPLRS
ncbi:MAG: hypothetical protein LUO93_05455, partial [Methanomicrobiales archaeon]|nr:hypothetical protein [Methanomicrobiales archaeon]